MHGLELWTTTSTVPLSAADLTTTDIWTRLSITRAIVLPLIGIIPVAMLIAIVVLLRGVVALSVPRFVVGGVVRHIAETGR